MITLQNVYDAFLCKVNEDDWARITSPEDMEWLLKDWRSIFNSAVPYFRFPRCSLALDETETYFIDEKMSVHEVEILAVLMKQEWLKRSVDTWENIKTQYSESDFSQANLLDTFIKLRREVKEEADLLERGYYRSRDKKPYSFGKLSGGQAHVRTNRYTRGL